MIQKVSTALDFLAREKEVIKFWNENDIFKKSIAQREGLWAHRRSVEIRWETIAGKQGGKEDRADG